MVTRMGHDVRPDQLLLHLADAGLSRYDMPEYMLFLDKLPLTASGKITKRELVKAVEEGRHTPVAVRYQRHFSLSA